jgi:hypothetical protein
MRCAKCGYVSFDHLNNCPKCSKDLSGSREDLNLLDFRPEVPFLLGSLVGEMEGGGAQQELSLTQETELELGGMGMSEPSASEGIDMGDLEIPSEENSSEEVSLSEIALDDLETIEASSMGDAEGGELQLDDLAEMSSGDSSVSKEEEGFLGLEIESEGDSFEDMGGFEDEISLEPDDSAQPATADPGAELELDLNDDDLSALAKELEDHLEPEGGEK